MDTLLLRILMPLHILTVRRIPTARRINLFMHSRLTATAAESVSDLATITAPGTMAVTAGTTAVTAGTTAVIVGIMVETTADITVAMVDTTVDMAGTTVVTTDITESMEVNDLCGLVRLGKFNLPSLPDES